MKVVIDIPEKYLNFEYNIIDVTLFTGVNNTITDVNVEDECAEFQVLPKGHGDLVDRDALLTDDNISDLNDGYGSAGYFRYVSVNTIKESPTVIPADKEVKE